MRKQTIKLMSMGLIIAVMCVSCGNNKTTKQTTPPKGDSDKITATNTPDQNETPEPTTNAEQSFVMYNDGLEVATSVMNYGVKLKNYAPSFGYTNLAGSYKYLLTSGQMLLVVAPPNVKKEWNVNTIQDAYDVMVNQGVISQEVGDELQIGGDSWGNWDRINLDTEVVTLNGIETMKIEGTVGTTFEFAGKNVSFDRYITGYIFIRPYDNGNFPACVIGTIIDEKAEKPEDIKDSLKEELRHNMKVMMESMEIIPGDSIYIMQ